MGTYKIIFWACIAFVVYAYFGYPVIIYLLSLIRHKKINKGNFEPSVTLLIPAYNEEKIIREKILNCLGLDYSADKLQIVIISDGSSDKTGPIVREYVAKGINLFEYQKHQGKIIALNIAVPMTKGEIIVFSDASGMLDKNAIREMTANFNDPQVGCVSGFYKMIPENYSLTGSGYETYLGYDISIKKSESRFGNIIGAHGAFYAVRRELFEMLPADLVNDDFYLPMKIIAKGFRAVYEEKAVVVDKIVYNLEEEFRRRVRIGFGNWQQILKLRKFSDSFGGVITWQFFSHKVLRIFLPFFLISSFIISFFIPGEIYGIYARFFLFFLLSAGIGGLFKMFRWRAEILYLPFYMVLGNIAYMIGTLSFFLGAKKVRW